MSPDLLEALAKQGLGLVIAVLALWWMRSDTAARLSDACGERERAEQRESEQRSDKLAITSALTSNTEALTRLTELIKHNNDLLARLTLLPRETPAKRSAVGTPRKNLDG